MARTGQSAVANCRAREPRGRQARSLDRQSEADIALTLDLVHELDLPAQIALAGALAGVGVIGPAPAILGCVGHGLPAGGEWQARGAPSRGAAVEHPDFLKGDLAKFGAGE